MSIAVEKKKNASERFMLVRLEPSRYIEPTSIGGGVYQMTFPYALSGLSRNGTALTKVSSVTNNDEYSFNETTNVLQVKLSAAPDDTNNILIAKHYLFYTGTVNRSANETPSDVSTPIRIWNARIIKYPSFVQAFTNIIQGTFTIQDMTLRIVNNNKEFQEYLTENDSFYNAKVEAWICINSVANIQKIYEGQVKSINADAMTVSIDVSDTFNKLKQTALMNDQENECYFKSEVYPNLPARAVDRPIPFVIGKQSFFQTEISYAGSTAVLEKRYLINKAIEAFCLDVKTDRSGTNNRVYGLCRTKEQIPTQVFGTPIRTVTFGGIAAAYYSSLENVYVGDTISFSIAAPPFTVYETIVHVGDFTYLGDTYNIAVSRLQGGTSQFNAMTTTIYPSKAVGIVVDTNDPNNTTRRKYWPSYGYHYTIDSVATSGGNYFHKIVFNDDFETLPPIPGEPLGSVPYLDPDLHNVYVKIGCDISSDQMRHGQVLKSMLEASGYSIDATTFDVADALLPVNAQFQIPNVDEDSYNNYLKYVEDLLGSTLGYLRTNQSLGIEYYLLQSPNSTTVRDSSLILDESTGMRIEYQDICTSLIAYNPHANSGPSIDSVLSPATSAESNKSRYLHGIVNVNRMKHCLEEISSRIQNHIELKSSRSLRYLFGVASEDLDSNLGDDLLIKNSIVAGGTGQQSVKITSLEKSPSQISVEAMDLTGLSDI